MKDIPKRIDSSTQSIGELLRKPIFYGVPVYQRDFAWTSEEIDTLWEDILTAIEEERKEYFLGAVVLSQGRKDNKREIVDGQQRLAVLTMIFAEISNIWKIRGDEKRSMGVFRDFLGSEDRRSGEVIPKLTLNETNDEIFQSLVIKGENIKSAERKTWPKSNELLYDAFTNIKLKVQSWVNSSEDVETLLFDLEEFLSKNTNLIVIEAGDESNAFVIFETLNDRGLELAVSDLVKNYLFSMSDDHIDMFKRSWSEMSLLLGSENLTPFLRHFWLSEFTLVRERDLYRALRNKVKGPSSARKFLERLRSVADFYAALMNPEHPYWTDYPIEVRSYLDALLLFKVTQFRPVLLAAMENFDSDQVTKLVRMLMVISFRYTVVSSLGTGNLEKIYTETALAIRNQRVKSLKAIFGLLKDAYVEDKRFEEDFVRKSFTKSAITRYILAEINDQIEGSFEKKVAERSGRITLEHILPKNPGSDWKDAIPRDKELSEFVDLIGNLTLLEKGKNKGIAAAGFQVKKTKAFSRSTLAINEDICKNRTWTYKEIAARSLALGKNAILIWRVGY